MINEEIALKLLDELDAAPGYETVQESMKAAAAIAQIRATLAVADQLKLIANFLETISRAESLR